MDINQEFKLCYVKDNFAYFTNTFESQWGDDWNDKPYHTNAGTPYQGDNKIKMIGIISNLETPDEVFYPGKEFSVEEINQGKTPWLYGYSYKTQEIEEIYAGMELDAFCKKVIDIGGRIFLELEEKE